jgi:hypothetical protein
MAHAKLTLIRQKKNSITHKTRVDEREAIESVKDTDWNFRQSVYY